MQRVNMHMDEECVAGESKFSNLLIELFSWGALSPQMVQRMAAAVHDDIEKVRAENCRFPVLSQMAKCGASGRYPNHCHKDLMKVLDPYTKISSPLQVKLPLDDGLLYDQKILLPHVLFSDIFHKYPATFERCILPDTDKLQQFWSSVEDHPSMSGHPIKNIPNFRTHGIPLGFRGDEVPITGRNKCWSKSMLTFSWASLVAMGRTAECLFWIYAIFEKMIVCQPLNTLDSVFKILVWSFEALFKGVWPDKNHLGVSNLCCIELCEWLCCMLFFNFVLIVWIALILVCTQPIAKS